MCSCAKKYSERVPAWKRHCSMLFMKQVLPRFDRPTAPTATGDPDTDPRDQGE